MVDNSAGTHYFDGHVDTTQLLRQQLMDELLAKERAQDKRRRMQRLALDVDPYWVDQWLHELGKVQRITGERVSKLEPPQRDALEVALDRDGRWYYDDRFDELRRKDLKYPEDHIYSRPRRRFKPNDQAVIDYLVSIAKEST